MPSHVIDMLIAMLVEERAKVAYLCDHMGITDDAFDNPEVVAEMVHYRAAALKPVEDRFGRRP